MEDNRKEFLSVMIYMWNAWSKEEAAKIFNEPNSEWDYSLGQHIWNKWLDYNRSIESLTAALDETNLQKLVDRACELYCGRQNKH